MSSDHLRSYISGLYISSLTLSLTVLMLSLLDLGFASLFLGIVGPCITIVHHVCTAFFLRKSGATYLHLLCSTLSIATVVMLAALWFAGSTIVTVMGTYYLDGKMRMRTNAVGTPETVIAQGVLGVFESFLLISLLATFVCARGHERKEVDSESVVSHEVSFPCPTITPVTSRQPLVRSSDGLLNVILLHRDMKDNVVAVVL